ncbi:MAG TPA: ABC transporter permease [Candidatus Dormibacteraeota bacterium]
MALRSSLGAQIGGRLSRSALVRQVALLALLIVTAGFWIFFSVAASGFTSDFNLFSLLRFAAIQITIGFAQMVALSIGDMNLAVGAIGGATGMFAGWAMQTLGLPPEVAVLFALAVGLLLGFGNALLITWTRINSFIVTLATASLITGAMLILTHARPFSELPGSFTSFSEMETAGLPISPLVLVMLAVAAALFFLYRNLSLGREMLAVGANRQAARMSGLSVDRVVLLTHGLSGALAATAGLMAIAADHTASPSLGSDWLLASFVSPAIGGTLLSGGLVSVPGTVLGGILLATISNGLLLVNIDNFWITVFLGVVLLLAVGLDRLTRAAGGVVS